MGCACGRNGRNEKFKAKDHLGNLVVKGRIVLNVILNVVPSSLLDLC